MRSHLRFHQVLEAAAETQHAIAGMLVCLAIVILVLVIFIAISPARLSQRFGAHVAIGGGIKIAPLNGFCEEVWTGIATNVFIDVAAKLSGGAVPAFTVGMISLALAALLQPIDWPHPQRVIGVRVPSSRVIRFNGGVGAHLALDR